MSRSRSQQAAPPGPAPHPGPAPLPLPLTLTFPCRAAPTAPARRHPVVIRADWTVDTGHDEELERIAAALGSGVSCIPALAGVLPAFREWWRRARRQAGPQVRSPDRGRRWHCADGSFGCCPATGFADALAAATHAREARHVAAATCADRRHLVSLVAGLAGAADPPPPDLPGADPQTRSLVQQAWAAGLPPDQVELARGPLARHGHDLDLDTLLGRLQTGADTHWLLTTVQAVAAAGRPDDPATGDDLSGGESPPSGELLSWLAWTATALDALEPAARAEWLATGARRADILVLSDAGYRASAAASVADAWGISRPGAAQVLARWVSSGYRPHPAHLTSLREVGLAFPPGPPAPAAVDRLARLVGASPKDAGERTGLAVAIVRHGTLQGAAVALVRARDAGGRRGERSA